MTVASPHSTVDVALRDGSTVRVRPVVPADRDAIHAFLTAMSPDSAYFRACGILNADQLSNWSIDLDYHDRYGILATIGLDEQIVGHAAYVRVNARRAEVAFEVADALHGQGVGTLLLAQLANAAVANGITEFSAEVMPANHKMLELFHASGFPIRHEKTDGLTELVFDTTLSPATIARFDQREREAARAALRCFLEPRSVAVIGASGRQGSLGAELITNVMHAGYTGALYPVNEHRHSIAGVKAFPTIALVPERVDLAVVIVPTAHVLDVARQCGAAGARSLVVVSGGFAETDTAGVERQQELLRICRATGMRLIGPNSLGVLNTAAEIALNASLIRSMPTHGPVGLMSQSGGVGVVLAAAATRLGIGLSTFVSVGNKADISGNDLLAYWDQDPATEVILLYLESFGNPRRFARFAQHVSAHKPVLAVKSGLTPIGGVNIAGSTTARLLTASDIGVDALFRQAGVIRTDTTGELLEAAALLATQPAPAGRRVAILSNTRGPALLCADACRAASLELVPLSRSLLIDRLSDLPGSSAPSENPVNLTTNATAEDYRSAAESLAASGECDALITLFVPSLATTARDVQTAIDAVVSRWPQITFATVLMDRVLPSLAASGDRHAVRYMFPEEAARALGHAARWSAWRRRPHSTVASLDDTRPEDARSVIARALTTQSGWIDESDVRELLDCYGLRPVGTPAGSLGSQQLLVGVVQDADFGPLVVCGRPGAGVAVRITPLTHQDAIEMVDAVQSSIWRPSPSAGLAHPAALAEVLEQLGAMVDAHPEISAMDIDPLLLDAGGATVGNARVHLSRPSASRPLGALR